MKKVWCYNCYGVCIARMTEDKIPAWNESHALANQKITDWAE